MYLGKSWATRVKLEARKAVFPKAAITLGDECMREREGGPDGE